MSPAPKFPLIAPLHGGFAQGRSEPLFITLFRDWMRLTTDEHGEMNGGVLEGFFAAETQFITFYRMRVDRKPLLHRYSVQTSANQWFSVGVIPGSIDEGDLPEGKVPAGSLELRVFRTIQDGWTETLHLKSNSEYERSVELLIELACPISDTEFQEEMKKESHAARLGLAPEHRQENGGHLLRFERNFGKRKHTPTDELRRLYGDRAPCEGQDVVRALEVLVRPIARRSKASLKISAGKRTAIRLRCKLQPRDEVALELRYEPEIDGVKLRAPEVVPIEPLPRERSDRLDADPVVETGNSTLNLILAQASSDLESLRLDLFRQDPKLESRKLAAFIAGVPRYVGIFSRDVLITACEAAFLSTRHLEPSLAHIAALRGVRWDAWRDEEPNRLPHERRMDPLASIGCTNRELYYGDVTGTPYWIIALGDAFGWLGDPALLQRHRDAFEDCCRWVERRLLDGRGFIYYEPACPGVKESNRNQAWKDSGDAIVDEQGRIHIPPLAVAEVQAYAYQALRVASGIYSRLGNAQRARELGLKAQELKARFNDAFWMEEEGYFALALDSAGTQVAAIASNAGECIDTGIIDEPRLSRVVRRLMQPDMFSGWGVRTLSNANPGFDPLSYHRGSVWPAENSWIVAGLARTGYRREAEEIVSAQFSLATIFQHMRLPEVIGGHARDSSHPTPALYPYANLLQAWSVAAISTFVQSLLGLSPWASEGILWVDPELPPWLPWVSIRHLRVGDAELDLRFWRESDGTSRFEPENVRGRLEIRLGRPGGGVLELGEGLGRRVEESRRFGKLGA